MENLLESVVFQTVISGVLVWFLAEMISIFVLKPFQKFKGVIGKIDNGLKFYRDVICNPDSTIYPKKELCSSQLRQLSCDLEEARKQMIIKIPAKTKKVAQAAQKLMRLSNALNNPEYVDENFEDEKKSENC